MNDDTKNQLAVWQGRVETAKASANKHATLLKWGVGLALCAAFSSVAISGLIGALAIIAFMVVTLVGVNGMPVLAKRLANAKTEALIAEANRHINALKTEAERNPIETLQNSVRRQAQELNAATKQLNVLEGELDTFRDQAEETARKFPALGSRSKRLLAGMERKVTYQRRQLATASEALQLSQGKCEEIAAAYSLAQASARFDATLEGQGEKVLQEIIDASAFSSANNTVNQALAGFHTSQKTDEISDADFRSLEQSEQILLDLKNLPVSAGNPVGAATSRA